MIIGFYFPRISGDAKGKHNRKRNVRRQFTFGLLVCCSKAKKRSPHVKLSYFVRFEINWNCKEKTSKRQVEGGQ